MGETSTEIQNTFSRSLAVCFGSQDTKYSFTFKKEKSLGFLFHLNFGISGLSRETAKHIFKGEL